MVINRFLDTKTKNMENYKDREIKALKSKLNDFQSYVKDMRNGIGSVVNEPDSKKVGAILLELLNTKTPKL